MSPTEFPVPKKNLLPPETPVQTESPVRYLLEVHPSAYFFHANRAFVEGRQKEAEVANPIYLSKWVDIWIKLPIILLSLALFMVAVNLLSIFYGMVIGVALLLVGLRLPYLILERYGDYFSRQVTKRFHEGGQLIKGELLQCTTGMHSTRNPYQPAFWVKIYYTFHTPAGQWIRGWVHEPREDLQDQQLPAPGTRFISFISMMTNIICYKRCRFKKHPL